MIKLKICFIELFQILSNAFKRSNYIPHARAQCNLIHIFKKNNIRIFSILDPGAPRKLVQFRALQPFLRNEKSL